jgi:hypothetical protein
MRSRYAFTKFAPYAVAFALVGSALVWQSLPSHVPLEAAAPPKTVVANYAIPAAAADAPSEVIAELPAQTVKPFSLLGVTWASGMPRKATIEVQWHGSSGWSDWTELHQDLAPMEDGPGRPGTEPQWVEWADGVAVRVTNSESATPVDVQVSAVANARAAEMSVAPAAATQPGIIMRSQWGARSQTSCADPKYGPSTQGAVIHHTVGTNSYSQAESAKIVRAIQAYHMDSRQWCDIGYNFLVDRYGQIFEGRAGGIDRAVRAAHAGNDAVNQQTVGVALMGTFDSADATPAMKEATAQLVAWRFQLAGLPAKGTVSIGGVKLNRISGHRDVVSTDCPGAKVYAWLGAAGGLRDRVAQILAPTPLPPAPDGAIYRFWSPKFNSAHFYTMSRAEADYVNTNNREWVFEGVPFKALPASGDSCSVGSPVYRFWSSVFRTHFYTASKDESDHVRATDSRWEYEGVAYCAYLTQVSGSTPLYRFWSPVFHNHFYTSSQAESDHLRTTDPNWTYEGIAYYVLPV